MGKFIAVVGIDGCGKDTQVARIAEILRNKDKYAHVWITREPTKLSKQGQDAAKILSSGEPIPVDSKALDLARLFIWDRKYHSGNIRNILSISDVVSSRYDLCTYAYQIAQISNMDSSEAMRIMLEDHCYDIPGDTRVCRKTVIPDITFLIDVHVDVALERIKNRSPTTEIFEKKEFLEKVRQNYLAMVPAFVNQFKRMIIVIDGNKSVDEVTEQIKRYL